MASFLGLGGIALFVLGSLLASNTENYKSLWELLDRSDLVMAVCVGLAAVLLVLDIARPRAMVAIAAAALAGIAVGQFLWFPIESKFEGAAVGLYVQTLGSLVIVVALILRVIRIRATAPVATARVGSGLAVGGAVVTLLGMFLNYLAVGPIGVTLWELTSRIDVALAVVLGIVVILLLIDVAGQNWGAAAAGLVLGAVVLGMGSLFPIENKFDRASTGAYLVLAGAIVLLSGALVRLTAAGSVRSGTA